MKRSLFFIILIAGLLLSACSPEVARFQMQDKTAIDVETGVTWMKNANLPGKPLPWRADENVFSYVQNLNTTNYAGYADWRLPTKDEIVSDTVEIDDGAATLAGGRAVPAAQRDAIALEILGGARRGNRGGDRPPLRVEQAAGSNGRRQRQRSDHDQGSGERGRESPHVQ